MPDEIRPVTPDSDRARLIAELRKQSVAIYIAVEKSVADDIAGTLRQAADLLAAEGWQPAIDPMTPDRPTPEREPPDRTRSSF